MHPLQVFLSVASVIIIGLLIVIEVFLQNTGKVPPLFSKQNITVFQIIPTSQQHKPQWYQGYVLSLGYYDQVTSAVPRMASLQCLANQWGMAVVEPFVDITFLSTVPSEPRMAENMRFRNLFNISKWNTKSRDNSYSTLTSYEEFLGKAPRNVVLVELNKVQKIKQQPFNHSCTFRRLGEFWHHYLAQHHFKVIQKVCSDLRTDGFVTVEESRLFQRCPRHNCTIVFSEWKGIIKGETARFIPTTHAECGLTRDFINFLTPSYRILQQAKDYALKYLQGEYTGVMLRWEVVTLNKSPIECLNSTLDYLVNKAGPNNTFVTHDLGPYGSKGMRKRDPLSSAYNGTLWLLKFIYGNSMTIRKYDERFTTVSRTQHPAYISVLQKTVAAKAKCLLLFGFGHFQEHALTMWKSFHPGSKCFRIIRDC